MRLPIHGEVNTDRVLIGTGIDGVSVALVVAGDDRIIEAERDHAAGRNVIPVMFLGIDAGKSHERRRRIRRESILPAIAGPQIVGGRVRQRCRV